MSEGIVSVNSTSFDKEVLESAIPVLVDFWAEWCGPCRMLSPILAEVSGDYLGKAKIAKVNVDENPELAQQYGVRGIPTIILFKDGKAEVTKVGLMTKSQLSQLLDQYI